MGLYGVLVVTDSANPGKAYGQAYDKDVALLLSEIDPVQNAAVKVAVNTAASTRSWSGTASLASAAMPLCTPAIRRWSTTTRVIT